MSIMKTAAKLAITAVVIIFGAIALILMSARPVVSVSVQPEAHTQEFQKAFFEASKVYGKVGCGDQELAEMTARNSISIGVPAGLLAAMASAESGCNPLAISNRGAVGLVQVVPKIWGKKFDFSQINLLNSEQNMHVGATIMSDLIKQHGIKGGLARYYGTGNDGIGLGGNGYAEHVLQLAGKF